MIAVTSRGTVVPLLVRCVEHLNLYDGTQQQSVTGRPQRPPEDFSYGLLMGHLRRKWPYDWRRIERAASACDQPTAWRRALAWTYRSAPGRGRYRSCRLQSGLRCARLELAAGTTPCGEGAGAPRRYEVVYARLASRGGFA